MKILHIGKFYSPIEGGIESINKFIVDSLKGNNQRILSFNNENRSIEEDIDNATIVRAASSGIVTSQPLSIKYFWELRRYLKIFKPDIVHFHYPNPLAALFIILLIGKHNKLIVHWHSDIVAQKFLHTFIKPIEQLLLKRADTIIATSPNYKNSSPCLKKHINKTVVIPCSIDEDKFILNESDSLRVKELKKQYDNKKIIFFIGRHVEYKGLEYLLDAEKYIKQDFILLIAGQGPLTHKLKERFKSERIKWVGRLPDDEMKIYYHAADIFAFPSITKNEAFGVVLAEAMFCECPTVTFKIEGSGVNWVSLNNETGIEVTNSDSKQLAEAFDNLLSNESLRLKLGQNAKMRVINLFSKNVVKSQYIKLYDSLYNNNTLNT